MHRTRKIISLAVALGAATAVLQPGEALARKKGVLDGEPAVRKNLQLRKLRFQITPKVGMSLSQPFVHEGYAGADLGVHFTDWIGIRAGFMYGVVKLPTKLHKDLVDNGGLPEGIAPGQVDTSVAMGPTCTGNVPCRPIAENDNPAPLKHDFQAGLTHAAWQSSFDIVFTPFVGKLGFFSSLFTEYDIYLFGGLGLMGWQKYYKDAQSTAELGNLDTRPSANGAINPNYCRADAASPQNDECVLHPVSADKAVKVGFSFGAGVHLFLSQWAALNLEVQDIVTSNNLTGLNATVADIPPAVAKEDRDAFHNVTLQLGAKFYIPFKVKRGR
jgi:hypothetical protein